MRYHPPMRADVAVIGPVLTTGVTCAPAGTVTRCAALPFDLGQRPGGDLGQRPGGAGDLHPPGQRNAGRGGPSRSRSGIAHPCYPGFDTLGMLVHLRGTGYDHSWFVLTQQVIQKEFALSGSEQNPDLTGKSIPLLLKRVLPGAPGPVEAFKTFAPTWWWRRPRRAGGRHEPDRSRGSDRPRAAQGPDCRARHPSVGRAPVRSAAAGGWHCSRVRRRQGCRGDSNCCEGWRQLSAQVALVRSSLQWNRGGHGALVVTTSGTGGTGGRRCLVIGAAGHASGRGVTRAPSARSRQTTRSG